MEHYFQRLQQITKDNWDRKAVSDYEGDSFTFGQLYVRIKKLHILFEQLGLQKGDRIAICGRNQAGWAICFLAANTYGAVAVPILVDFTPDSICSIIDHSGSRLLFTDDQIWGKLDRSRIPSVREAVRISDRSLLSGPDGDAEIFDRLEETWKQRYPAALSPSDVAFPTGNDTDLAVINYTSGSTGDPKGVMLRYECFSANIAFGQKLIPSHPGDNILSVLPMSHMFGLMFELLYPLCGGAAVTYLCKTPSPSLMFKAMREVKPYLVIAVPMIFEKIYRSSLKPAIDKPAVKALLSVPILRRIVHSKLRRGVDEAFGGRVREYIMGGAAVNPEVEDFLKKIGFHFTVGYGMTEAGPLLAYSPWRSFVPRSCGRAIDCVELRIDSEDPENIVGEIQARGISIFSGYYRNEQITDAAFTPDGWFNTGDLGLIDKRGNVYIKGRSKSMILTSNGQNIYPEEIEGEINSLDNINESLVVARDSKIVALVYLDQDASAARDAAEAERLKDDIKSKVNSKVPAYSRISEVELVKEPFLKTPKLTIKRFLYA